MNGTQPEAGTSSKIPSPDVLRSCDRLVASYFLRADRLSEENAAELFVDEGHLTLGRLQLDGKRAIAEFFTERARANAEMGRTTRHLSSSLEITAVDEHRMTGRSTVIVFAGVGSLPLTAGAPSTVCDFDDAFVRTRRGWLFDRRVATVIFTGDSAANFSK